MDAAIKNFKLRPKKRNTTPKSDDIGVLELKDVELYSAHTAAWFTTRMEFDKSILALSTGGLGLLLTLITSNAGDVFKSALPFAWLLISAIVCFCISILLILIILAKNSDLIEQEIGGNKSSSWIPYIDKAAVAVFYLGIFLSAAIAICVVVFITQPRETVMTNEKKNNREMANDSFASMNKLGPVAMQKSLQGSGALKAPAPQAAAQKPAAPPQPATKDKK